MIKEFTINGRSLSAYYINTPDAEEAMDEIFVRDCYRLGDLSRSGYRVDTAIDVGAHMGHVGRLIHFYWPRAKIVSFEPDPELIPVLTANVGAWGVEQCAVRYHGDKRFYRCPHHRLSSCVYDDSVNRNPAILQDYEEVPTVVVPLESVNEWTHEIIDLLKLDCEGSEYDILDHMSLDMCARIWRIVGEYHCHFGHIASTVGERFKHLRAIDLSDSEQGFFEAI